MRSRSEAEFLLTASRPHMGDTDIARLREAIARGIGWSELIRLALPHGLMPLLAFHLDQHAADLVPAATLAQFRRYREQTRRRNEKQARALVALMQMFTAAGIPALPFKGPLLALAAYGDVSLRESHDLDIWLPSDCLERAGILMRHAGYCGIFHKRGVAERLGEDRGQYQTEFLHSETGVIAELHDELQSEQFSYTPRIEELWQRRVVFRLLDTEVPALAPEDLVTLLAVHGSKHVWRRVSWLTDIAALIKYTGNMDWNAVCERARVLHATRRLVTALVLVDRLYQLPPPPSAPHIGKERSHPAADLAQAHMIEGLPERNLRNFLAEVRFQMREADRFSARTRVLASYVRKILGVEEEEMLRGMPQGTATLYRLYAALRGLFVKREQSEARVA